MHSKETRQTRQESRNYSKYFETRRKATRGACYRGKMSLVMPACQYLCTLGKDGTTIIQPQPRPQPQFFVDPWLRTHLPVLAACLPCPPLVCGTTLNTTTATPTRTGLSRRPRYCAGDCVSVWFRSGGCGFCLSPSLLHASSSSTACLLPLLVLPVGTLGSAHPRSHHSVV